MSDLKPLGSEKLSGQEQINRILEMSNYGSKPSTISENKNSSSEYSIQLADGNYYGIVKEKTGYIVKKGINESELDYAEPMQNRKHYRSFSQAMKKINLFAGELNRLFENAEGVNIIGEQKKFVLKTPKPEVDVELDIEEPLGDPIDLELDTDTQLDDESMDLDMDLDLDSSIEDEELDLDVEDTVEDMDDEESDEEEGTFKVIQKLTGKIGQKLRTYDKNQGLSSEDIKYVINSILSAVTLEKLSEEDKEDILANFEEDEVDYEMDGDVEIDSEDEDLDLDLDLDLDMEEPIVDDELSEQDSMTSFIDEIFTESKVDKVLGKYFVITEGEKKTTKSKNVRNFLSEKVKSISVKKEIKRLSKTVEQELTSEFLVKENRDITFLGKTNKGNLVFESKGKQLKVSTKGELL